MSKTQKGQSRALRCSGWLGPFFMQLNPLNPLNRITGRKHDRPIACEANRSALISTYMNCDGLTLTEAEAKFKRENRKAWARACA